MDVKTTFLNGDIEEEAYIEQLEGFVIHEQKSHACRFKKALYGLKQTPRAWYEKMDGFLISFGFNKSVADPNVLKTETGTGTGRGSNLNRNRNQ
jgi:hypothetical protein